MSDNPIANPALVAAVNMIGAVSPAARPMDIIIPVSIEGRAAGSITPHMARHFPAPSPRAPSRYELGTAFRDSSHVRIMVGSISSARVNEPANTLLPSETFIVFIRNASPKSPNTIDGTPARVPTHILRKFAILPFPAYSEKYIAAAIPSGAATIIAHTVR